MPFEKALVGMQPGRRPKTRSLTYRKVPEEILTIRVFTVYVWPCTRRSIKQQEFPSLLYEFTYHLLLSTTTSSLYTLKSSE